MRDFEALDQLFASTAVDDSKPLKQEKTHYGVDGPVKVTGPSPGSIGPAKKAAPKKAAAAPAKKKADPNEIWGDDDVDVVEDWQQQDGRRC